jgi:hypothetical protein
MAAPDRNEDGVLLMGGSDRGEVGALVLMTLAFVGWVAAAFSLGEGRMWFFGALAAVLTLAAMALMRPAPPQGQTSAS